MAGLVSTPIIFAVLEFDHVIFAVRDFDVAADRIEREHGLGSVRGGSHSGQGTGNRIIPLGSAYVELMAVVDEEEAAGSLLGRWVLEQVRNGDHPAALCLRTDDIASLSKRLGLEPMAMSRLRPDGQELAWRLAGLTRMFDDGFPFFIEWRADREDLPGLMPAAHTVEVEGISWVEIGGSVCEIDEWLGPHRLDLRVSDGSIGVLRVGIGSGAGELILE